MNFSKIVFCDFDGTITEGDSFVKMCQRFAPQSSRQILSAIYDRSLNLKVGAQQLLNSIESDRYSAIIDSTDSLSIRPGLRELLDFLAEHHIPFIVVSGGLRGMVEAVLNREIQGEPLIDKITAIYATDIDLSEKYLRGYSVMESDRELVAKAKIMSQYLANQTIAIGDSVTDISMALKADVVFARDRLIGYLEAEKKPYIPWNDFFDVRNYLQQIILS
ncbi:MAG: HAD-IB family phosphatase [Pleurocapsa sp.]